MFIHKQGKKLNSLPATSLKEHVKIILISFYKWNYQCCATDGLAMGRERQSFDFMKSCKSFAKSLKSATVETFTLR